MKPVRDSWVLFRRSFREGLRSPAWAFLFPTLFPLFMITLTSQSFREIVRLPGFPLSPYAAYEAPAILLLAAMMGAGYSATGLALDAQTGFLDRLRLLPVHPAAILAGRLLFDVVRVLPAGLVVLVVSLALDARLDYALPGAAVLLGLLGLWSLAYNGIFYLVALQTKNAQAPLALVPLFMPLMFVSPAFLPLSLQPEWIQTISAWNPYSYVIEGARAFMTGGLTWVPVRNALLATAVILVSTQLATALSFRALVRGD